MRKFSSLGCRAKQKDTKTKLLECLLVAPTGLTRKEICHTVFRRNRNRDEIEDALTCLEQAGAIYCAIDRRPSGGGTGAQRWFASKGAARAWSSVSLNFRKRLRSDSKLG